MRCDGLQLNLIVLGLSLSLPASLFEPTPALRKEDAAPGLTHGDWQQIRRSIRVTEYDAAPVMKAGEAPSFVASNRAQGYRTTFRREGVEIVSKACGHEPWRLGVFVTGYGHEGDLRPLPGADPIASGGRVEYRRGPVTEWYVNRPVGLEQGFTIAQPARPRAEPIVIALAVESDLGFRLEGETSASFSDAAGRTRVRYADLSAWDAGGRPLAARLEASRGQLRVLVDARGARFPVTVDPVFVEDVKLEGHGDAVGANAGYSVSVSGDTALVGAPFEDTAVGVEAGSVYVFVRSGGVWSPEQKLLASDGTALDAFGFSVSVSGDTAVIGARLDDTAGGVDAGSAYVFVRSGTVWSEQQKLVASDGAGNDYFGWSVSVSGDTVLIGASNDSTAGGSGSGSAYVFVRSGTVWSEQQKLVASDGAAYDSFGTSVSVSGDAAVVGVRSGDSAGGPDTGSAFAFVRSGTVWSEQQKLVASDGASGDGFGISVSVSGDTVAVGACFDETAAGAYSGSAYVFVLSGAVWSEQQKLLASDGAPSDMFGCSVSLSGDTALVGAYGDDTAKGSAYVFVRSGTTWNEQQKLLASDGEEGGDAFGHSVSVSGDTTLVGARFDITPGGFAAGSAYAFARSGTIWSEEQKLLPWNLPADDLLGYSVSASGDTVVVGSPFDDTLGGSDAGSAYVFVRSGSGWSEEQKLLADDGAPGDRFGSAVSVSGDTLVIGAYNDDTAAGSDAGSAYVFVRSGTLWSEQQKLVASDGTAGDLFGRSVSVSGDTTVIGAPTDDTAAGVDAGSAYVFLRSGSVWSEQRKLVASDGAADDGFGVSVSISGDSAVAGSYLDDTAGGLDAGSAYVFVRSGTLWSEQQKLVAPDGATDDRFGYGVSISGDTAVVGAFLDDAAGGQDAGSAYVFERSGTAWSQPQKLLASDGAAHDDFGISVSVFGDTAVVGASYDDTAGGADSGSAYVFVRSGTVWSQQQRLLASDGAAGDLFGTSVSASGLWAVIGAIFDDTAGGTDAGSAYAFRASPISDLSVTITDGQATAVPGQPVTYTIVAMNAGPDPANDAAVWDALPESLTSAAWTCAGTGGGTCTASGSGSIYDGVTLPVGATVTYTLSATIAPAATGSLANTATVVYSPVVIDPDPSNNSATDADTLTPEADLELQKSDSPDPVKPGGVLAYALQVTNLGPSDSSGMTLTDALPPEVAFVSSTPGPPICTEAGGTVTCALPGLAPSTSQAVTVQATVSPGSLRVIVNTASVAGNETDPVSGNDTDTEPTTAGLFESELVHGTVLWADLAPAGGAPGEDLYRVGQRAYSSYEVAMDGTSGDIGVGQGPQLERLASDGSLLQSSVPAGAGGSRSLRWENDGAAFVGNEYVRVRSAGCTTTCGSEDVYRIRSWDTTLSGPRFNNSASQITILVLQNATPATVSGHARFWNGAGVLVGTQSFSMAAKGAFVVNTSVIPGLSGAGGTITLSHDGPYGTLVGKAVAVEPATGFTFDTPLTPRGRGIVR